MLAAIAPMIIHLCSTSVPHFRLLGLSVGPNAHANICGPESTWTCIITWTSGPGPLDLSTRTSKPRLRLGARTTPALNPAPCEHFLFPHMRCPDLARCVPRVPMRLSHAHTHDSVIRDRTGAQAAPLLPNLHPAPPLSHDTMPTIPCTTATTTSPLIPFHAFVQPFCATFILCCHTAMLSANISIISTPQACKGAE
jgi:hypothetical protein